MESAIGINMCRCCASEGSYKDLNTKFTWMGETEIYADMLQYCFDINLEKVESDNGGICEVCITQLRHASNFKKQVLITEEKFKKRLQEKLFSRDSIKLEMNEVSIDSDNDNRVMDDFSEPEYDVPIKEEIEVEVKPKKRSAKASTSTTSRVKKPKNEEGETSNKRWRTRIITIEPRPQVKLVKSAISISKPMTDSRKNQHNLSIILLNSNANPIRAKDGLGYSCAFCLKQFPKPMTLKKHFLEEHNSDRLIKYMTGKMFEHVVKLDITYLNCALCDQDMSKLDDLMHHLKNDHGKELFMDIKNQILPFKFDTEELRCAICAAEYGTFKLLQEHMNIHFRNYICDICSSGFVNERLLVSHVKRHGNGEFECKTCSKKFGSEMKRREHERRTHLGLGKRNKCTYCDERFVDYWKKMAHMVKEHGVPQTVYKCQACDRTFHNQRSLSRHTKKDHLLERKHKCKECDMGFFSSSSLKKHMPKHTGLRQFKCDVCFKAYGRKSTLREHMRIHADDRRFSCVHCGQAFVQKCSWRGHMRSKHGEEV